jgi:hypothetical protein
MVAFPVLGSRIRATRLLAILHGDEARAIEAIVDRIIPPDDETPGGKDAGCAVFIDRQLKAPGSSRKSAPGCSPLSVRASEAIEITGPHSASQL